MLVDTGAQVQFRWIGEVFLGSGGPRMTDEVHKERLVFIITIGCNYEKRS